jgi:hypothetical protein
MVTKMSPSILSSTRLRLTVNAVRSVWAAVIMLAAYPTRKAPRLALPFGITFPYACVGSLTYVQGPHRRVVNLVHRYRLRDRGLRDSFVRKRERRSVRLGDVVRRRRRCCHSGSWIRDADLAHCRGLSDVCRGAAQSRIGFVLGTFSVAANPQGLVTKLRASNGAKLGVFPAGAFPLGLAFYGAFVWVANLSGGSVSKL